MQLETSVYKFCVEIYFQVSWNGIAEIKAEPGLMTYFFYWNNVFYFLDRALLSRKVLILMTSKLHNFFFFWLLVFLVSYLRNYCLTQGHKDLHIHFLLRVLIVVDLTFKSLIHSELIFVGCEVWVQINVFACRYPIVPSLFVEKTILPPLNGLGNFIRNQLSINVWVYCWTLKSPSLIYMSILMPVVPCLVVRFVLFSCSNFEFGKCESFNFILFKIVYAILKPL